MAGTIRVETPEPGIARVVFDHPERLNALSNAMWDSLREIMAALDAEESLRCVILTGAGERAFGVGADISEFEQNRGDVEKARAYAARTHAAIDALAACRHPVIAAIRGLCVGGGLELACCADLRLCGEGARFGIPVKRLGLVVALDEMRPLVDLVGPANALQIVLEGEIFPAGEALRMGLVNRVVPDAEVEAAALASARRIAEGAPLVARWHKRFVRRLLDPRPLTEAERDESFACFGTEDFRIGYRAFLAKETPVFVGR
jgi:enoyl-CoA hydratase/carnithine racemase